MSVMHDCPMCFHKHCLKGIFFTAKKPKNFYVSDIIIKLIFATLLEYNFELLYKPQVPSLIKELVFTKYAPDTHIMLTGVSLVCKNFIVLVLISFC